MKRCLDRRSFLKSAGALAAAGLSPAPAPRRARRPSPNDRIGIGLIGAGDLGRHHHLPKILRLPELEVVAICDVDLKHLEDALERVKGRATPCRDYRQLLERESVDAVFIVTPDHWHALQTIHACEAGKDVYCEKPLSLTIAEGRAMVEAARRTGRVVQTGTQQRSDARFRRACELVRNGRLGRIREVKAVLGRGVYKKDGPPDSDPPAHLDWHRWLGPAPSAPYNPGRCHYDFRWFYDYSGGKLTDWGAHHLDIVQWGLGQEHAGPVEVEATGTFPADNFYENAVDFDVRYTYPGGITVLATGAGKNGVTFIGDRGEIFVSRSELLARPESLLDEPESGLEIRLPRSEDHHRNWIRALRTRERPIADVEIGHRSATVCHLGNIALALGRKLRWDPVQERFLGDEAANRLISKPMRPPWRL